jgi:hypothetical protein
MSCSAWMLHAFCCLHWWTVRRKAKELLKQLALRLAKKWEQPYSVTKGLSMLAWALLSFEPPTFVYEAHASQPSRSANIASGKIAQVLGCFAPNTKALPMRSLTLDLSSLLLTATTTATMSASTTAIPQWAMAAGRITCGARRITWRTKSTEEESYDGIAWMGGDGGSDAMEDGLRQKWRWSSCLSDNKVTKS